MQDGIRPCRLDFFKKLIKCAARLLDCIHFHGCIFGIVNDPQKECSKLFSATCNNQKFAVYVHMQINSPSSFNEDVLVPGCNLQILIPFVKSVSYQVTDTGLTVGTKNNRIKWVREFAKRISNSSKDLTMKILRNSVNRCKTV